jgi:uncharacterized membrane protein (DUF485 family)
MNTTPPKHNPSATLGGTILFCIYLAAYGLFVLANAWFPDAMTAQPIPGINLAVFLGIGLIFLTFAIAAIYVWLRFEAKTEISSSREDKRAPKS